MPRAIPELLAGVPVSDVALIGEALAPLADALQAQLPQLAVHSLGDLQALTGGQPGAQAGTSGLLPVLHIATADAATDRQLGAACRGYPARLWAIADDSPQLPVYLFSFGFRRVDTLVETLDDAPLVLFEFRLHDYKQRPDWLNARYWAHPERFDMTDHHND